MLKKAHMRKLLTLALTVALAASLFVFPASAADGSVTTTFNSTNSNYGIINGTYVNANGISEVSRVTAVAGNEELDGKYFINGVLKDSKLITTNFYGTATSGTTKVEVTIQNISTGQYLKIDGTSGSFVDEETFNVASGTTSWSIPAATIRNIDWPNGNYIVKAYATDNMRGVPSSIYFTVFNAQVVAPAFDDIAKGTYTVQVGTIELANGAAIQNIRADVVRPYDGAIMGSVNLVKNPENNLYEGALNTLVIPSDVYTLAVVATGKDYDGRVFSDFVIQNKSLSASVPASVSKDGTEFVVDGELHKYSGANNHNISMRSMEIKSSDSTAVIWLGDEPVITLVPTGSRWRFEEWTDRLLMEMKKTNQTNLRIWAFGQVNANPANCIRRDGLGNNSSPNFNYYLRYFWDTDGDGKQEIIYNDVVLSRFDYILYSAEKHGIMLQPTFENWWNDYGGIQATMNYVKNAYPDDEAAQAPCINISTGQPAAANVGPHNAFMVSEGAWEAYKSLLDTFIKREGTLSDGTKVKWAGNPAVFAWDLMNEPRYGLNEDNSRDGLFWEGDDMVAKEWFFEKDENGEWVWNTKGRMPSNLTATDPRFANYKNSPEKWAMPKEERTLYKWIDRASTYIKSLDPTHMVVAGTEGQTFRNPATRPVIFKATGEPLQMAWCGWTCQGFGGDPLETTDAPNIDFLSFHPYVMTQWVYTGVENDNVYQRPSGLYYTPDEAIGAIKELVKRGMELGKPVTDQELGVDRGDGGIMGNTSRAPSAVRPSESHNWNWNIHLKTAIDGGTAGFNSWQTSIGYGNGTLGPVLYQYNNARDAITSRRFVQYFIDTIEAITHYTYPEAPVQPAFPAPALKLDDLSVVTNTGVELMPFFDPNTGYYEATAPFLATSVNIDAQAADGTKVDVISYSGAGVTNNGKTVALETWANATVIDVKLAKDGVSATYRLKIRLGYPDDKKELTSFAIPVGNESCPGIIDQEQKTVTVFVPAGTSLTSLRPTFTITGRAALVAATVQTSGTTSRNMTNPTVYLVMAEDGSDSLYTVTVKHRATEVTISAPKMVSVKKGKTVQRNVTSDASGLIYMSSNPSIATVDQTGLVTGVKTGMAVITVAAKDNSQKFASIIVNVIA